MENNKNEMIYITMYADDTGLFSEYECNKDNTVGFDIPRWILEEWFKFGKKENRNMGIDDYDTFEDWYNNYIHDELIGFYDFCIIKGFVPNILNSDEEIKDKVFYEDDEGNKQIVFEGTYDECRRWCKYNGWVYTDLEDCDYDLKLEIE